MLAVLRHDNSVQVIKWKDAYYEERVAIYSFSIQDFVAMPSRF